MYKTKICTLFHMQACLKEFYCRYFFLVSKKRADFLNYNVNDRFQGRQNGLYFEGPNISMNPSIHYPPFLFVPKLGRPMGPV